MYTPSQQQALRKEIAAAETRGQPEVTQRIKAAMTVNTPFDVIIASLTSNPQGQTVFPETAIHPDDATELLPPRVGKGSSRKAWKEFAEETSTIDPEVLDNLTRDDIISVLEDRGIILPEPI